MKKQLQPLRYTTLYKCIAILIPSKRGGYLKTPVYHSHNPLSKFIADTFDLDAYGLDGYLGVNVDYKTVNDPEAVLDIVKQIAEFLGFGYEAERMSNDDFFILLKSLR